MEREGGAEETRPRDVPRDDSQDTPPSGTPVPEQYEEYEGPPDDIPYYPPPPPPGERIQAEPPPADETRLSDMPPPQETQPAQTQPGQTQPAQVPEETRLAET